MKIEIEGERDGIRFKIYAEGEEAKPLVEALLKTALREATKNS